MELIERIELFHLIALLIALAAGYLFVRLFITKRPDPLGIDGKLIWVDRGRRTKPFFNKQFKILGKPDLMYKRVAGGVLAVEYKSRRGRVYESDVVQAKSAALAARGAGYAVCEILVKTKGTEQRFPLPKSDSALFSEIKRYVDCARAAKKGQRLPLPARPQAHKCRTCAFGPKCSSAA